MARQFAVLGLSTFGHTLALELQSGGEEVLAVDREADAVQRISETVSKAICADIRDVSVLDDMGLEGMSAVVIAMPKHFDVAVLATRYLAKNKVPQILVEVVSETEADALMAVGATKTVFPDEDMAYRVAAELLVPGSSDLVHLGKGTAVIKIPCPSPWVGKSLEKLQVRRKFGVNVIAVFKDEEEESERDVARDPVPAPDRLLEASDQLFVFGLVDRISDLRESLPPPSPAGENER